MNPLDRALLLALYPDFVQIRYVPNSWDTVKVPLWDKENPQNYLARVDEESKPVKFDVEEVALYPIYDGAGVYAGLSPKTRILFVAIEGV